MPGNTRIRPGAILLGIYVVLIFAYLVFPVLVIIPLSFSSGKFLTFPPPGFSLRWYANFFGRGEWTGSAWLSIWVGLSVTVMSVLLGTPAAIALVRGRFPGRRLVLAFILSPVIAPGIIVAIGVYFAYAQFGLVGHPFALVLAHVCLAVPFVVINVSTSLQGVDRRIEQAAQSLGATPWATFRQVTLPLIRPGIFAGAVFAFITSFDELLVALFLSGTTAVTLPRRMWEQIRFDIDPTIAAVSTLLITLTSCLLVGTELLRRRTERARTRPLAELAPTDA
ncbi:MAG TPA: ABC transporter permease [Acetobacteraceae bacterium]|nr:ABC transporter permease [Acetobacteraceae bacterium]